MRSLTITEISPGNFVIAPHVNKTDHPVIAVGPDSFVSTELGMKYSHSTDAVIDRVLDFFKTPKEENETP